MKLIETKADMRGSITAVNGDDHFMNRITSIGITEGTTFQTVRNDKKMPVLNSDSTQQYRGKTA